MCDRGIILLGWLVARSASTLNCMFLSKRLLETGASDQRRDSCNILGSIFISQISLQVQLSVHLAEEILFYAYRVVLDDFACHGVPCYKSLLIKI